MASAYHHAPNHIRRMLNQLLFEHVYLVPHDDTRQLTATATCIPPFDSILGWSGSPTDSEQTSQASGGHEVANTRPDMQPPNRQSCLKPPKTAQNKPCSTQKPTPEVSQDVGLSVEHLVGLAGFEPTTP
jgi:recombinase